MNVLLLTYSYLPAVGGVQRSVAGLGASLAAAGHRVTIATHRASAFPLRRTPGNPALLHLHVPSQAVSRLSQRAVTAALNAVNGALLVGVARARRIALVHAHHLNADTIYAALLARRLGIPFVLTLRGGETEEWIERSVRRRRYLEEILRRADFVTAVSRSLLEQAASHVPEIATRSAVIPNPVDPLALERELTGTSAPLAEAPFLLFAGRLAWMKDVGCLLDAFHELVRSGGRSRFELWIVGDGPWRALLERRAGHGWGRAQVRFLGSRDHAETLALMRASSALVLPSRASEGCPNVVLEAMALGTPVVVSDLPSSTELVEADVTGSVFPRGDVGALTRCLRELAEDPARAARYARAARERIASRHEPGRILAAYQEIYDRLVAPGTPSRAKRAS